MCHRAPTGQVGFWARPADERAGQGRTSATQLPKEPSPGWMSRPPNPRPMALATPSPRPQQGPPNNGAGLKSVSATSRRCGLWPSSLRDGGSIFLTAFEILEMLLWNQDCDRAVVSCELDAFPFPAACHDLSKILPRSSDRYSARHRLGKSGRGAVEIKPFHNGAGGVCQTTSGSDPLTTLKVTPSSVQ